MQCPSYYGGMIQVPSKKLLCQFQLGTGENNKRVSWKTQTRTTYSNNSHSSFEFVPLGVDIIWRKEWLGLPFEKWLFLIRNLGFSFKPLRSYFKMCLQVELNCYVDVWICIWSSDGVNKTKHGLSVQSRQLLDVLSQPLLHRWGQLSLDTQSVGFFEVYSHCTDSISLHPVAAKFSFFSLAIITK